MEPTMMTRKQQLRSAALRYVSMRINAIADGLDAEDVAFGTDLSTPITKDERMFMMGLMVTEAARILRKAWP